MITTVAIATEQNPAYKLIVFISKQKIIQPITYRCNNMLPLLQNKYNKKLGILFCCNFIYCLLLAQQHTVIIQVTDAEKLRIGNASIAINQQKITADTSGIAFINLLPGNYYFTISAVNHFNSTFNCTINRDTTFNIVLKVRQSLLSNVTVYSSRNVTRNQMSTQTITSAQLKKIPVILGEIDPLKTITLLPGIKSGGEASAGIYVRGGGPEQNLVLLDGIQVYNPNHLFGFFSIFNGEAIKNVEVIKGGIPAEYGGRLSSVINIDTRDGNKDSIKGSGGIGLIASRLALEGPIIKGKSSFIISARRTYIDQIAKIVASSRIGNNGYFFYDINAKVDYTLNKKSQLLFTLYKGKDDFIFSNTNDGRRTSFNTIWGNALLGLQWKQQVNKALQQQTAVNYNKFVLDSKFGFSTINFLFTSGLQDYQVKSDWQYASNKWLKIKWGAQYIWHQFTPGAGGVTAGVQDFKSKLTNQFAQEAAAYISSDINITNNLNIVAGLRYSYFNQVGPNAKIVYGADGVPTGEQINYTKGQSIAAYHYPEPRLGLLYKFNSNASLKASYTKTVQYIHLATTSSATFPSDLWVPSSSLIKPALANQMAIGFFKNLANNKYECSIEAYYKTMSNQIEFKPGAQLLLNQNLDGEMIFGSGKAYGIEFFIQKKQGKLTGWIGYTLSKAERNFNALNNGQTFTFRYDRTHDLSVVANYAINKKWEASMVFVYGTGNALTLPTGRYTFNVGINTEDNTPIFTNINQYSSINDYRMPAYHRLDVAFIYTPKPLSKKRFKNSWNFSIYNVYNRYNPFFIYLDANETTQTVNGKKVYLFPIVPSVTWNFKF